MLLPAPLHPIRSFRPAFRAFGALALAMAPLAAEAQQPSHDSPRFRYLTIADGLSQNAVSAVVQDRHGFLWFGTKDGLNRYDGHAFRIYRNNPFDPRSLSDNSVTALHVDRDGQLWVGTEKGGLDRFDRDLEIFHHTPLTDGTAVNAITQGIDGNLWVATNGAGLARLPALTPGESAADVAWFRHDPAQSTIGDDFVYALLVDRQGALWVGHRRGLDRLDAAADAFVSYGFDPQSATGLMDDRGVTALLEDRAGRIWMGLASGISMLNEDRTGITHHRHRYAVSRFGWGQVKGILEDRRGTLWLATPAELMRFDPSDGSFQYLRHDPLAPAGVNSDVPTALLQDRSEVIWVGTNGFGLNIHDPKADRFRTFVRPEDRRWRVSGFSVYTIFEDSQGALWIDAGLLYRWDRATGAFTSFQTSSDRPDDFGNTGVWALLEAPRGFLWAGSYQGLYHYEIATGRARHYRHDPEDPEGLPEMAVYDLLLDPAGRLWVVTERWLAELVDPAAGRFRSYRYSDRQSSAQWTFPSLVRTGDGVLWFGSPDGLVRFDPVTRTFRHYRNDPADPMSLSHDRIRAVLADPRDPEGTLWVGTAGGGLNRFDVATGRFTHYTTRDGLPNDVVYAILADEDGRLWLSTNRGLSRFDPANGSFRNFDAGDGLQSDEFNSGAAFRSRSGEMFFGGIHGLNYFRPSEIRDNPYVPNLVITGFRRLNRPENVGDTATVLARSIVETHEIRLRHSDNILTFEFAALDFSAPSKNRYVYRMRGFSDEWIEAGPERTATFTNLPPGSYTFEVRGSNNDGVWNEDGAGLALIILPPWWRTRWAIALYVLILAGLGLAIRRYELNRIRLKHRVQREHEAAEQLRELDRARSRFFANISHEFRTPLTLTLGPLDDLRSGFHGPLPAPVQEQVELARRNAARVLDLINQILDLARVEAGHTPLRARRLDLGTFVAAVVQGFRPYAERKALTLDLQVPAAPITVYGDPDQLEKVLANLLSNALKFTPVGGIVRISVAADGDHARVAVRDSGPGIPAAERPRIFDRFHRVESTAGAQPGTGIGLALARELTELHGGLLTVESEEGFGSTFTMVLRQGRAHLAPEQIVEDPAPWMPTAPAPVLPAADDVALAGDEREDEDVTTVLVIDDNAEIRSFVRRHLAPRYRVVEAGDGVAGLEMARALVPDLILSDVMMPGLDGYAFCRALRSDPETDFIPVILLTARAEAEDRLAGLREEADDYITKPFDVRELLARTDNLIALRKRLRDRFAVTVVGPRPAPMPSLHATPVVVESEDRRFLEQVHAAIEAHLADEDFTVERLARQVAHSRGHLHRRLREVIDESPSDLIRRLRLERAAQLLEARAGSIAEIAYSVGFKSVAHFSNRFHDQFGVRPSAWAAARKERDATPSAD